MKCVICKDKIDVDTHKAAKDERCCSAFCLGRLHTRDVMRPRHGEPFTVKAMEDFMELMGMGPLVFKPGMNRDDFEGQMNQIIDEFNQI